MSLFVDDCTHPARNGRHEVYIAKGGGSVCRACGKRGAAYGPLSAPLGANRHERRAQAARRRGR